jgi:hypothetical protein
VLRRMAKAAAIAVLAGAVVLGFADGASAAPGGSAAVAIVISHNTSTVPVNDPFVQQAASVLKSGGSVDLQDRGSTAASLRVVNGVLQVKTPTANGPTAPTGGIHPDWGFCTAAIAAEILAVGVAVILTLIAIAVIIGAPEVTILGITLSVAAWSAIAGAMGSWAALLAAVATYIC